MTEFKSEMAMFWKLHRLLVASVFNHKFPRRIEVQEDVALKVAPETRRAYVGHVIL